jgi:hypothetical protein
MPHAVPMSPVNIQIMKCNNKLGPWGPAKCWQSLPRWPVHYDQQMSTTGSGRQSHVSYGSTLADRSCEEHKTETPEAHTWAAGQLLHL